MPHDPDIIREFVVECREGLDRIDSVLVALEADPNDNSRLDVAFRSLHTIKGNAGFLEFPNLGAIAHAGESLLTRLIGGALKVTPQIADVLLRLVDAIRGVVDEVAATSNEGRPSYEPLIRELTQFSKSEGSTEPPVAGIKSPDSTFSDPTSLHNPDRVPLTVTVTPTQPSPPVMPEPVPPAIQAAPVAASTADSNPPMPAKTDESWTSSIIGKSAADPELSTVIRVQIDHLDDLMNLVGELVLTRNRIVQITSSREDDELTEPIQRLHRLTAALQDGVMRTRMQPLRNAWKKYPRIVRDLARQCGKQCEVELQGGDTELDKSMLEAIADPLVHLVRNAIDHGIEKPYLRKIKGKPEAGRLLVRAFQESGQVHIEISDDGAGLDLERIRRKVVEVGMLSPERALLISETDLRNSVFLPGFTTAERVTSLSGRGVGMDVVKTCVEQIGGTIELHTQKDVGTTIRLTVPLTLAIVPAVMVRCGTQRFAIPHINVVEMLRLQGDEKHQACDQFHDTPVLRLRGELVPMADLCRKLQIDPGCDLATRNKLEILVLKTGTRRFALLVDEIGDAQEIVVKPLGDLLARQTEYNGAALMGDGSIALILDVLGIARSCGLLTSDQSMLSDSLTVRTNVNRLDEQILVCEVDGERQIALPLSHVICLEQVPISSVEHSATGDIIQYRDAMLPLHQLSRQKSPTDVPNATVPMAIVVYRTATSTLGLLVDRIIDVAPHPGDLSPVDLASNYRDRVVGTAVVLGRITDFLQVS